MAKETSWGAVSGWYDETVKDSASYQSVVILPNLLRVLNPKKGESILDLACGQGFFSREISKKGAVVTGVDISPELIAIAKKEKSTNVRYEVASAERLDMLKDESTS
jgi:2-polyprenyl-3-methyl-5-hydroxy-6-metoxy-1,4-benzoquinol methylase